MRKKLISVSNIFGDYANGQELLEHFTAIWGGHDGFYHAWRWYEDGLSMMRESHCTRKEYPDVFAFADSLFDALELAEV